MIPHLYHRSHATMNGIIPDAYADDAIMCDVVDTLNGALELELEVPYTQRNIKWYEKETIIGVDIPDRAYIEMNEKHQFFRVYDVDKDLSSMKIKMKAFHVSNLLAQLLIIASDRVLSGDIAELWSPDSVVLEGGTVKAVDAEVGVSKHLRYERKNWLEAVMDEKEGVANKFGMDVIRHNHGIKLVKNRGVLEAQVRLHAEANIKNVNIQERLTNPVIAILPYAKINVDQIKQREEQRKEKLEKDKKKGQKRTKAQIEADKKAKEAAKKAEEDARRAKKLAGDNGDRYIYGNVVKSPLFAEYQTGVIIPVDFSGKDPDHKNKGKLEEDDDYFRVETVEAVNEVARNYYQWEEAKNIDKPSYEFSIDMIEQLPKDLYDSLRYLSLGDEITLVSHKYYMDINARVTKITWDILTGTKKNITGGTSRKTVYEEIRKSVENLKSDEKDKWVDEVNENLLKQFDSFTNSMQDSADGKNTIYSGPDEPTGALVEGDTWFKTMPDGKRDLYIWNGTEWSKVDFNGIAEEIERQFKENDDLWSKSVEPRIAALMKERIPIGIDEYLKDYRTVWEPVNLLYPYKNGLYDLRVYSGFGQAQTSRYQKPGVVKFTPGDTTVGMEILNYESNMSKVIDKYRRDVLDSKSLGAMPNNFDVNTYILGSNEGSIIKSTDLPDRRYPVSCGMIISYEDDKRANRRLNVPFKVYKDDQVVVLNMDDSIFEKYTVRSITIEVSIPSLDIFELRVDYLYKATSKTLINNGYLRDVTVDDPYGKHPNYAKPKNEEGQYHIKGTAETGKPLLDYSFSYNFSATVSTNWLTTHAGKVICFDISYKAKSNLQPDDYINLPTLSYTDSRNTTSSVNLVLDDRWHRAMFVYKIPTIAPNTWFSEGFSIGPGNTRGGKTSVVTSEILINDIFITDQNNLNRYIVNDMRRYKNDPTIGQLMNQTGLLQSLDLQETYNLGKMMKFTRDYLKTSEIKQDLDSIKATVREDMAGKLAQLRIEADAITKNISNIRSTYQTIATAEGEIRSVREAISNTNRTMGDRARAIETRVTQLAGSWAVRQLNSNGDIISQINMNNGNIKIDGKSLRITANTVIDNGTIKTAMIGQAQITGAKIAQATIESAHIVSLDVGKISGSAAEFASGKFGIATINKIITDGIRMRGDRNSQGDAILQFSQGYMAVDFSNQDGLNSGWATLRVAGRIRAGIRINGRNYQDNPAGIFGGVPVMTNAYEDDPIAHFDNNNRIWPISFIGLTQKNGVWYLIGEDGGNGRQHRFWIEANLANNQSFGSKKFPKSSYPNTNWLTIGL